jgi:hypothetical protein
MKRLFVFLGMLLIIHNSLSCQIAHTKYKNILLKTFNNEDKTPFIKLNFDPEKAKEEKSMCAKSHKTFHFAKSIEVSYDFTNSGKWMQHGKLNIWKAGFYSPGAHSLNVIFSKFKLPKGVEVFIYNPSKDYILGGYNYKNNKPFDIFAVAPIPGDSIIIECRIKNSIKKRSFLRIGKIAHDYKNIFKYLDSQENLEAAGSCNKDVKCPLADDWQQEKNAVSRILYNGSDLCTGTLINNTKNNAKPYVLTANHCLHTNANANSAIFIFQYESPYCSGPTGKKNKSISGSNLVATADDLDFSLVELTSSLPFVFFPFFAGWDVTNDQPQQGVTIHHPQGDVKKISIDENPLTTASYGSGYKPLSHWRVSNWEYGTTEKGSSGCPVFNEDRRIIGDLTGGEASCSNPINDYFAKLYSSWDTYASSSKQLKTWLDPLQTGNKKLNGYNPINDYCDTITNIGDTEQLLLYFTEKGYITGHSANSYNKFAEHIRSPGESNLIGMNLDVSKAYSVSLASFITVKIWKDGGSIPGDELYSKNVLFNTLKPKSYNFVEFDSTVVINGDFFAGYQIYYYFLADTFALYQAEDRGTNGNNTAYIYYNNTWQDYKSLFDINTALSLEVLGCNSQTAGFATDRFPKKEPVVYPNPASNKLIIDLNGINKKEIIVELYSITGKKVLSKINPAINPTIHLSLHDLKPGLYIVRLTTGNEIYTKKIIKN